MLQRLGQSPFASAWQSGRYYFLPGFVSVTTSATLGVGTARAVPFWVPNRVTLTRLGAEITSAGEAGSKFRLGIYADDGTGRPGALVLDAGQINGDSATVQEITVSQVLRPGSYFAVGVVQTVTTTQPMVRVVSPQGVVPNVDAGTSIPAAGAVPVGFSQSSVTGALPSAWTGTATSGSVPRIFCKVA